MTLTIALAALLIAAPFANAGPTTGHARDRMLLAFAWAGALALFVVAPGPGIFFACALARWIGPHQTGAVLTWAGLGLLYVAVLYGPRALETVLPHAIVAGAAVQTVLGIVQYVLALRAGQTPYQARDAASAAMTGRVVLATLIAMAVPLAPLWILPLFVVGLVVTASYVGVAAALFGFFVAHPTLMVPAFLVSAPALFVVCWYRRRAGDSWRARVRAWQLGLAAVVRGGWPAIFFGLGPGAWRRDATYWNRAAGATVEVFTTAHNDLVETLFEYGLLGMLALGLWGWTLAPGMAFGDPVTGAMVAALVCAMGHFPAALPQTSIPWLVIAGLLARRGI
jgi:hypothetical protein